MPPPPPPKPRNPKTRVLWDADWEPVKAHITVCLLTLKLEDVMPKIKQEFGFEATCVANVFCLSSTGLTQGRENSIDES
jgi:hypothetical protein